MITEPPKNYRIIVEIGKSGFISKQYATLTKAKLIYNLQVIFVPRVYLTERGQYIRKHLKDCLFTEYSIPNNGSVIEECMRLAGNGEYSVALIEVDPEKFCLKSFIKERQSTAFIEFSQGSATDLYAPLEEWVFAN